MAFIPTALLVVMGASLAVIVVVATRESRSRVPLS